MPMSGDATKVERKGVFRLFSNYRLFALIGAGAIVAGVILGAVLTTTGGTTADDGDVRGDDVIRTTPEPGSTASPQEQVKQYPAPPPLTIDTARTYTATIKTDKGDVKVELLDEQAPQAVNNFVFLARDGYYNGVEFFRVVEDFVAQTGDPTGTGVGGPGYELPFEATDVDADAGIVAADHVAVSDAAHVDARGLAALRARIEGEVRDLIRDLVEAPHVEVRELRPGEGADRERGVLHALLALARDGPVDGRPTATRSQRAFTKLSLLLLLNDETAASSGCSSRPTLGSVEPLEVTPER